jgi:hypothetical protein
VLNRHLRQAAEQAGGVWTRDVVTFAKGLVPAHLSPGDEAAMAAGYEDFARRHGLLLGPAARPRGGRKEAPRIPERPGAGVTP